MLAFYLASILTFFLAFLFGIYSDIFLAFYLTYVVPFHLAFYLTSVSFSGILSDIEFYLAYLLAFFWHVFASRRAQLPFLALDTQAGGQARDRTRRGGEEERRTSTFVKI
jgi:hypothetical protein